MGFFHKQLEKYHETVNVLFSSYGAFAARRPFIPLVIGVLILGALCIGLLNAKKESELEVLWVGLNSRVIPEKNFFDTHFGGLSRKEAVTINTKSSLNVALPDYGRAMDALTEVIKPLYNLTYNAPLQGKAIELDQGDFCERPRVPQTLRKGPARKENYLAWGYRNVSTCVLDTIELLQMDKNFNRSLYGLPSDWGFDAFPCFKLSPMDCFREGSQFDYPEELQQLEQPVAFNQTMISLNLLVYGLESRLGYLCLGKLQTSLTNSGAYTAQEVTKITSELKPAISAFAAWGYNWRKSYKDMKSHEILDYVNEAINTAKHASTDILDPAVSHCIMESKPCCVTWFGTHLPITASFGSVEYNASGSISEIGAMRWGANNWNHDHPLFIEYLREKLNQNLDESARKDLVLGYENLMITKLSPFRNGAGTDFAAGRKYGDLQVQFAMWRSAEDVLVDANKTPIWQLILSAVLVSMYSFFAFLNIRNPVHSHTALVLTGLTVVSFAIVAGFGLTSAFGIKLSPLAGSVVPFLALGLGIDDVFVLVTILRNFLEDKKVQALSTSSSPTPEHEMRLTTALAGPSVVLTTFSVLASFFISSLNRMPIVRWFCWQMGITATIHTFGMLLIFIPVMALDAKRVKSQINDPNLWLIFGRKGKKGALTQVKSVDGTGPTVQESTASSPISIAVAKFYAPLFNSNLFKIFVVIICAGLLGTMTYLGFWKVEHGLKLSEVTLKGSYQHDYAVVTEDRFPSYDIWLVTQDPIDYPNSQQQLIELYNAAQQNLSHWLPAEPKVWDTCWLGNVYLAINQSLNLPYPLPAKDFYSLVEPWTTSVYGGFSLQDLNCYNTSTGQPISCLAQQGLPHWGIKATKTALFVEHLGANTGPNLELIRNTRKFADGFNDKHFNGSKAAYMFGYPFLFFEQYLHIDHDLYTVVGFALVGVFLAVLVFQFSITTSLIIALVLLMVDIEVYGFLYLLDAKLNALSLVNLGIVIGMASEFTYLARSFLVVDGKRNYRVGKALEWTFEPLLHGFGTQVAATLPLVFLKYHAFRVYYFAMFTIMGILGFMNGFVLLPVLLSWFGPPPLPHVMGTTTRREVLMGENGQSFKPSKLVNEQNAGIQEHPHNNNANTP